MVPGDNANSQLFFSYDFQTKMWLNIHFSMKNAAAKIHFSNEFGCQNIHFSMKKAATKIHFSKNEQMKHRIATKSLWLFLCTFAP